MARMSSRGASWMVPKAMSAVISKLPPVIGREPTTAPESPERARALPRVGDRLLRGVAC